MHHPLKDVPMDRVATTDSDAIVAPLPIKASNRISAAWSTCGFEPDQLLQALPAAVYTTDAVGRITFYNEAAAALWGRHPELGKSEWCGSWRLYWPDGTPMPHDECPMAIALKEKRPIRGAEAAAERPDGSRIPFLAYPTPLWDEEGVLTGAVNTLIDISDRKEAERAARQLAAIVESSDDAIASKDLDGIILTWNRGAERLFGYTADEVIGKPITILIPPELHYEETLILGRIRRGEGVDHYETVRRRKDGSEVEVSLTVSPIKDAHGRVIGASKIARDISDRREAERSARQLAAIVASSEDAIVGKDLDGIILTWNRGAERLFGYTADEVTGKPITILIPPERHDEETLILGRIRRGERVDHYETVRRRKDGSQVEVSLTVSPIKNAHGRVIGASKIARDITDRKRAEEQQRLLLKEMNHRVKNLFALAGALITLSVRSAATPNDLAESVRERLTALARANDLTLPDLTEGREASGRATTLPALVRTIVAPYVAQDHASVTVNGPDVPVGGKAVMGIALLLHEIATNAAKYGALSSRGGSVAVSWSVRQDELFLTWQERGGPPVEGEPKNEGFGSLLARLTVTGQLGGTMSHAWDPEGLTVTLSAPLERLLK
jgi:PAS domain S-box-containing protein